jgi:hypothetical protein
MPAVKNPGMDVNTAEEMGLVSRLSEISLQGSKALRDLIPFIGFHRSPGELQD